MGNKRGRELNKLVLLAATHHVDAELRMTKKSHYQLLLSQWVDESGVRKKKLAPMLVFSGSGGWLNKDIEQQQFSRSMRENFGVVLEAKDVPCLMLVC